jgi:hypothetical protein
MDDDEDPSAFEAELAMLDDYETELADNDSQDVLGKQKNFRNTGHPSTRIAFCRAEINFCSS